MACIAQFKNWAIPLFCFPDPPQGKTECKRILPSSSARAKPTLLPGEENGSCPQGRPHTSDVGHWLAMTESAFLQIQSASLPRMRSAPSIRRNTDPPPIWRGSCRCIPKFGDSPLRFGSRARGRTAARADFLPEAAWPDEWSGISAPAPHQ